MNTILKKGNRPMGLNAAFDAIGPNHDDVNVAQE